MIYGERCRRAYEFVEVTRFASSLILRDSHREVVVSSLVFVGIQQLATLLGIFQILETSATATRSMQLKARTYYARRSRIRLASELGISCIPALTAYALPLAEDYFEARAGAGTFVCNSLPERLTLTERRDPSPIVVMLLFVIALGRT